jgi:predicted RNase H-like nuclease
VPSELLAVGVDGARGGWLAAAAFGARSPRPPQPDVSPARTELHFFAAEDGRGGLDRLADWRRGQPGGDDAPVAIDVPIGLPELGGSRPCDYECRAQLPGKASSVFPAPARFLVERFDNGAATKHEVRDAIRERRQAEEAAGHDPAAVCGISTQSCAIFDKVWETDRFVRSDRRPDGTWPVEGWFFEVHPELCLQRMRDAELMAAGQRARLPVREAASLAGKKTARGQLQRLASARDAFGDAEARICELDWSATGNLDDALDAYAALWTAMRVARYGFEGVEVLGRIPSPSGAAELPRDARGTGLLMRMVV